MPARKEKSMDNKKAGFNSIDEYIQTFPEDIQKILQEVRATIKSAAPDAEETISYSMPAFRYYGILVYFAGFKNHIGFFPTGKGIESVKDELSGYEFSKGTIRFPINKPIPFDLIRKIIKNRVAENLEKAKAKAKVKAEVKVKKKV